MPKNKNKNKTILCLQELLLILEECWASDPLLHGVPIYQASGLARRAMTIYQTYIEMMNEDIQAAFQVTHSALGCIGTALQ